MTRHIITFIVGALGGLLVWSVLRWRAGNGLAVWWRRIGHRTALAGLVAAVLSGTFYSVVHEFGHVLFAVVLGGRVRSVTWTIFSNVEPHVSYSHLPLAADPWARAGGYLLPTGLALALIAAWFAVRRRSAGLAAAMLLVPAAVFLAANLGAIPELFEPHNHLRSFAAYYGLGRAGEIMLSLCLASVSIALISAVVWIAKKTCRASAGMNTPQTAAPNRSPAASIDNSSAPGRSSSARQHARRSFH